MLAGDVRHSSYGPERSVYWPLRACWNHLGERGLGSFLREKECWCVVKGEFLYDQAFGIVVVNDSVHYFAMRIYVNDQAT